MKCSNCGAENPEEATFCIGCGSRVTTIPICSECHTELPAGARFCFKCGHSLTEQAASSPAPTSTTAPSSQPTSFANGRYTVKKFLGEGGKKKVYLAHDTVLDRDVAFALIKTEKLDESARTRIIREAQAMGRLGDHPNIVTVYDFGEHEGQPYMVLPLLPGGDIEGLIEKAPEHKLSLDKIIEITKCVCHGLEFAHSKGIIHRDIKPGNVWMSADGTAKIGDFGLAVSVDLSRLTQSGMMVGTVSYMPPEQAMGGKVTDKADIYSLGAMLYEMVTGRPPFVGDDSIAIIGQHINTPPVSPAWHRADLPPAMEALIMQLLEKDPERRPASAAVVLQALEAIEAGKATTQQTRQTQETPQTVENPLYRRVFVGREQELKQLQSAFDAAISGQGALMMVVGEPGIGKTAVCEQLQTYATLRGGKTLVGHCYEEGSLSLPYLAFVEAMRSYVLDRDAEDLKKELGSGATDVARIVSEIREKLHVQPRKADNPEEDRYRLLQAVTSFLSHAASVKPMLVILEDLHDADKGTLEMLSYVSRNLAKTRLLIVGTYRDVEVDRNHPLSAALAELRRASFFGRIQLRGLNADEVSRMLNGITGEEVPFGLAEAVHRQTEGNPLFVQEVIRYLNEQKLLIRAGGKMIATGSTPLEMSIPEGLRDVIGKRLSALSEECNRLLSIAAVIGRDFRLDVLQKVAAVPEDEVLASLEEAKRVAIIEERSGVGASVSYRFAHAFFRTTLYEENIAPRRIRLHQQVARALEEVYKNRLQEHAAELAEHFSYSTEPTDLTKAVSYSEMAAQRAMDVYDYGEAVRLLRQALKVQEVLDPDDKAKRCDLLLSLAEFLNIAGDPRKALDNELPEAFSLAESLRDTERLSKSCTRAIIALVYIAITSFQSPEAALWAEREENYAEDGTLSKAWADFGVGLVKYYSLVNQLEPEHGFSNTITNVFRQIDEAFELAKRLNDTEAFWFMTYFKLMRSSPQNTSERWKIADELAKYPRKGVPIKALSMALTLTAEAFLEFGQRAKAEEIGKELAELAERTNQANTVLVSIRWEAELAILDGKNEEFSYMVEQVPLRGEELGIPEYASLVRYQIGHGHLLFGNNAEISGLLPSMQPSNYYSKALYLAYLNRILEAQELLEQRVVNRPGFGTTSDQVTTIQDMLYLQAAILSDHRRSVEMLFEKYADKEFNLVASLGVHCVPQNQSAAAAFLGRK